MAETKSNGRKLEYEKIRVWAMFFTIATHSVSAVSRETQFENYMYDALVLIFRTCNGLFFLLSGKFALAAKCESFEEYYDYYTKKVSNLCIPILFYMFLQSIYDYGGKFWQLSFWKEYVKNVFSNYAGKEYWFLYTLLGMILLAPFLNKMLINLKKGEMWLLICMGLLYNTICVYAPYVNLSFRWSYILGGWVFYFVLGYCLEEIIDTTKKENIIILLGGICFIISIIQKQFDLTSGIYDLAPTYTFIVCATFFLLRRNWNTKINFLNTFTLKCGKYSFAIYMVHNPIRKLLLDNANMQGVLQLFVAVMCIACLSFILVFICENTIIKAAQYLVGRLFYKIKRKVMV